MQEEWRDIEGFEGLYQVSNLGKVKSLDRLDTNNRKRRGRILKPSHSDFGYLQYVLHKDNKPVLRLAHRLVAEAFISNPNNLPQVNHINEDKENNCVSNLEWCSAKYNSNYGTRTERQKANTDYTKKYKPIFAFDGRSKQYFESTKQAGEALELVASNITSCLKGRQHTTGGYAFKYVIDKSKVEE